MEAAKNSYLSKIKELRDIDINNNRRQLLAAAGGPLGQRRAHTGREVDEGGPKAV